MWISGHSGMTRVFLKYFPVPILKEKQLSSASRFSYTKLESGHARECVFMLNMCVDFMVLNDLGYLYQSSCLFSAFSKHLCLLEYLQRYLLCPWKEKWLQLEHGRQLRGSLGWLEPESADVIEGLSLLCLSRGPQRPEDYSDPFQIAQGGHGSDPQMDLFLPGWRTGWFLLAGCCSAVFSFILDLSPYCVK